MAVRGRAGPTIPFVQSTFFLTEARSAVLTVDMSATGVLSMFKNGARKIRFAIVNALNSTAKDVQAAERERVFREFTVRKRDFMRREAAVIRRPEGGSGFARIATGRYEVRIAVGQKPRLLLGKFELGGTRPRFTPGSRAAAVPLLGGPARVNQGSAVPLAWYYKSLQLHKAGEQMYKGKKRTFTLISNTLPQGGVMQRTGRGAKAMQLVYVFRSKLQIDKRLEFIKTAYRVAVPAMNRYLQSEISDAFRHRAMQLFKQLNPRHPQHYT